MKWAGKIDFDSRPQYDADGLVTNIEVDTISGSLQTNIDGKSDTSHIHDDRYYTSSEVDDLITTISGNLDDHNELNNLDYASSGHTGFQPSGDYTTTSELTSMSGILQTNIDEKSDIGHLHDDRYYTESEVDTISGSLQTNIDTKSDTDHIHDDRYYTESEISTISGSLQTNIDGKPDTEWFLTESVPSSSIGKEDDIALNQETGAVYKLTTFSGTSGIFAGIDDGYKSEAPSFNNTGNILYAGNVGGTIYHTWVRFTNVTIPNGATITEAFIKLNCASAGPAATCNLNCHFNNVDSAVAPTDIASFDSLVLTSAIPWDSAEVWSAGVQYDTPNVSSILQGVINRSGWSSGNAIQAIIKDNGSINAFRQVSSYEHSGATAELHISWNVWEEKLSPDFLKLSDTPTTYSGSVGKYLKTTNSGIEFSDDELYTKSEIDDLITTISGKLDDHNELNNLDYASSGHTGFQPAGDYATTSDLTSVSGILQTNIDEKSDTNHIHDDRYYTETELNAGQLDNRYYTESEVNTISGSLQTGIDDHGHVSTEITVAKINTPIYDTLQEWINNTQSAGRMSGGDTSTHTDAVTGVTVSGAGYGEFKVSGDQTAGYIVGEPIQVTDSTNNDGYYTVSSGVAYSGGTTTIPVDEAVAAVADGDIVNGTVDVSDGTGFIKQTDSDIAETVSFNVHADTNIILTDIITNYVYVDYNSGTPNIKTTTDRSSIEWNRQFPLSMVYRNGARTWVCSCGIYLPNKTRLDHERVLTLRGYERATGGEISEYGTRNIQSTAGVFYRGSNEINTTLKASVTDKITTVYYNGSAWVWTENETQIDNTYYNNIATGLVELGSSKYAVHWVCIDYLSNLYVVYGRGSYSLAQAELAAVPSFMPVIANEFGIIAAKIIIQKAASSFTELISAYTQLIPSATPATHNALSGLNDGDYKHLTAANHTDLTDGNVCTAHKHDISEDSTPDLGGQLGVGEYDIKFDSLLSADEKYSGSTCEGVLGDTLAFGDLVYLNTTDQRWEKTDADAETTSGDVDLAIVLAGGNDGDTRLLLSEGFVREDDWSFTSYGKALYIATASGTMTQTAPTGSGDIVRVVGYASTFADQIHFNPSKVWIELS